MLPQGRSSISKTRSRPSVTRGKYSLQNHLSANDFAQLNQYFYERSWGRESMPWDGESVRAADAYSLRIAPTQDHRSTGPQDHRTTGLQDLRPHAVPPEKVRGPWSPFCRLVNSSICLTTDCRQNRKVQSAWRKALNYDYRTTRLQDRRTAKPQDKGTTDHGLRTTVPPEEVSGHVVSGPWSSSGFRGPVGPCRLFCGLPDGGVPPPRP